MVSGRGDDYSRLAQSVDEWVEEVTRARSALAQSLSLHQSRRPAFRLPEAPGRAAAVAPAETAYEPVPKDDARKLFLLRVTESEQRARDAHQQLERLTAELEFAREQLHLQNRLRGESEKKWVESEREREATVHALGRAQISLDDMRRQLRGKEWALEKAKGDVEDDAAGQPLTAPAVEELQREASGLHSRLETLTAELQAARDHAAREQEAASLADQRRRKLEDDAVQTAEIVEGLSAEVSRYAEQLREAGRELDEARAALAHPNRPKNVVDAQPASDYAEIELKLQLSERRSAELAAALESAERVAHERISETIAESAVLSDNFDALAASHMTLRDEVAALQSEIVARDHELERLRAEVTDAHPANTTHAGAAEAAELTAAIEALESDAVGQEYLVQALRRELDEARESLNCHQMDQRLLTRALKAEVDNLRELAKEHDFVIHHQGQQLDAATRLELDAAAEADGPDRETLNRELVLLRQRVEDKDAVVRRLRAELAQLRQRTAAPAGDTTELEAVLRNREADLARTRDRVEFLRRALREKHAGDGLKHSETGPTTPERPVAGVVPAKQTPPAKRVISVDAGAFDVSKFQANSAVQREVEQSLAFQSAWPLIAIFISLGGFGLLALAALAFMLS